MDMDNGNYQPPQPAIDPMAVSATVRLPVGVWNRIYQLIGINAWNEANPIIAELQRQVFISLNPPATVVREPEQASNRAPLN